jgi:dimethylglycine dehydrogenase
MGDLIAPDVERIVPELAIGFERFPCLARPGIKRWVNSAFTFAASGNPIIGPGRGAPIYWLACDLMAGFSQGGGVGKALAEWMVYGEPQADVFGMDIARCGGYTSNREYLKQTARRFCARRFVLTQPTSGCRRGAS